MLLLTRWCFENFGGGWWLCVLEAFLQHSSLQLLGDQQLLALAAEAAGGACRRKDALSDQSHCAGKGLCRKVCICARERLSYSKAT